MFKIEGLRNIFRHSFWSLLHSGGLFILGYRFWLEREAGKLFLGHFTAVYWFGSANVVCWNRRLVTASKHGRLKIISTMIVRERAHRPWNHSFRCIFSAILSGLWLGRPAAGRWDRARYPNFLSTCLVYLLCVQTASSVIEKVCVCLLSESA